jgi:steroid delta-isomerase
MNVADIPEQSMGRVKAKDKAGWLALYADDAVVEDPVGGAEWDPEGKGQRGKAAIGAFYDMFSTFQSAFEFEVHERFVCGNEVAALVSMHITNKEGVKNTTKAINVYKINDAGKVQSLRSFWTR